MTRRRDGHREHAYQDLLDAVERGDESAIKAMQTLQQLRAKNETYVVKHSPHHGWRVYNQLEETRPLDDTQPLPKPKE